MLFFFAGLSIYSRTAHKLVMDACNNHRVTEDKKRTLAPYHVLNRIIRMETGKFPFPFFLNCFRCLTVYLDADLLAAAVALVNGIIAGEKTLSDRMRIRSVFKQQLERVFAKQRRAFPNAASLIRQLDTFDDIEKQDNVC